MSNSERQSRPDEDLSTENPRPRTTHPSVLSVTRRVDTLPDRVDKLESAARDNFDRVQANQRRLSALENLAEKLEAENAELRRQLGVLDRRDQVLL